MTTIEAAAPTKTDRRSHPYVSKPIPADVMAFYAKPAARFVVELATQAVAAAQAAGNAAYAESEAAGGTPEQVATAYHFAYQASARESGVGPYCPCDYCAAKFGVIVTEQDGWPVYATENAPAMEPA